MRQSAPNHAADVSKQHDVNGAPGQQEGAAELGQNSGQVSQTIADARSSEEIEDTACSRELSVSLLDGSGK